MSQADEGGHEPRLSGALRMTAYAVTAGVFAWPVSVLEGVVAAVLGAAAGAWLGRALSQSRVRTPVVLAGVGVALGVIFALEAGLSGSASVAAVLGPSLALRTYEAAVFGLAGGGVAAAVRVLSLRHRSMAALEVGVVALSFAQLVVAHRNGAIHRPYEIADPILSSGGDPTLALLAIGGCAGAVIALLLMSERSAWRALLHLGVMAALLVGVLVTTSVRGPPPPPAANDGLHLRDDSDARRQREQQGRGSGGGAAGPDFQDEYDNSGAQAPLALVLLHDDYSPPSGVYYFRQEAFSRYNGRRLVAAGRAGIDDDAASGFPTQPWSVPNAPETGPYRSTVETTVGLLAEHPRPFGLESPIQFVPVQNPDRQRFRRTFRVRSAVLTSDVWGLLGRRAGDPSWSPETRAHYEAGPADPRYRALADEMVSELPDDLRADPFARALAVTHYLGREGTYSLRSRHAGAADPTADFLFGDRTGYCVHFAHAAVYAMRALGLPARVATGYMVPESARRGGSAILISGGNSHAWPEVYVEGVGWVVVDVTPMRSLDPPPAEADEQLQQLLAEMLRGLQPLPADGSAPSRVISETVARLRGPVSATLAVLLLGLILSGYAVKAWRRLAPRFSSERARARRSYRAALDALSEVGLRRSLGTSPEAFASSVGARVPSLAPLIARREAEAWGSKSRMDPFATVSLAVLAGRAAREARVGVPFARRVVGWMNPFSWLLTR